MQAGDDAGSSPAKDGGDKEARDHVFLSGLKKGELRQRLYEAGIDFRETDSKRLLICKLLAHRDTGISESRTFCRPGGGDVGISG